jgi:hypothetical protein
LPGGRQRSFRLGDRAELLVQQLLSGLAFTTPVPRQEDIGIDFMCSLITGHDNADLLTAGPLFLVQAKSSNDPVVYEKPHELEWIGNQENPILLCVADRDAGAMDIFSTWNLLCAVLAGWRGQKQPNRIRLCPGKTSSDWPGIDNREDGSQDVSLGPPIVRITHNQIFDESATKRAAELLAQWVSLDRQNIVNRRAGLNWVTGPLAHEPGKCFGPELGVAFYWHPQNLIGCTANLGRSATALWRVLRHPGISTVTDVSKAPWPAGLSALREMLRWCRDLDPGLRGFLNDLDE